MAEAVGNIHVGLYVNVGQTRRFSTAAGIIDRDSHRIRRSLDRTSRSVTHLRTQTGMNMRSRMFGEMMRQATTVNSELGKLRATMMGLAALTGTSITGAFAATWLLQTADRAKLLNNQLRTVTDTSEHLAATQKRLYDLSQESRSGMDGTVRLYARMSRAAEFFGMKQEDLLKVTETIQKAFAVGGASTQEAWGAAIQLSQGIASDRFSGEEYRSVSENAPVLLQEMARGLGVNIGKLREMAHAGELTGKAVTTAILGASKAIDEDFQKTVVTVGQAMTRVGNAFLMYIGEGDKANGVTRRLSDALSNLAENFDEIAGVATWLAGAGLAMLGGKVLSAGSKGIFGAMIPTKADRAELGMFLQEIDAAKTEVRREMAAVQSTLAGGPKGDQFARTLAERHGKQISRSLAEETKARGVINKLQVDHLVATEKINNLRTAGIAGLKKQVEVAKARNAADALRVGNAQKLVAAEQAALAATRKHRLQYVAYAGDIQRVLKETSTSKTLEKRMAAEVRAVAAFDKSLGPLQTKMRNLSKAMTDGFDSPAIRKIAGQINDLDRNLAAAQVRLTKASRGVAAAAAGDARLIAAAETERAAAIARVNKLQGEAVTLTNQATAATARLTGATKALAAARRVGRSLLNFVGGPVGVAFIGAILAISHFSSEAAKAEEKTRNLKAELNALGLISDEVAGIVEKSAKSLEELAADEIRNKLREINEEIAKIRSEQNLFEKLFGYDPSRLGNMKAELDEMLSFSGMGRRGTFLDDREQGVARELLAIIDAAEKGEISIEDLQRKLDTLALTPDMDEALDTLIGNLRLAVQYGDGLATNAERLADQLERITANGNDTWLRNMIEQQQALDTAQAGVDSISALADEQIRVLGLTEEQAALEDKIAELRKAALEALGEDAVLQEYSLKTDAQRILLAEQQAEKRKEAAEAQQGFNDKVAELSVEIDEATGSFEDMQAAATLKRLLADFATGTMKADTLKTRLGEINSVNLSDPMNTLIGKIMAAIGPLATLLGIFQSFDGGATSGPFHGRGAVGRSRRELQDKQAIGQRVLDGAIADAGMSERDAFIKERTKDLKEQAAALGGVARNAEVTAARLWDLERAQDAAAKAGEDQAKALEKSKEAMAEYAATMGFLDAELETAGRNLQDKDAADNVRNMVDEFVKGKLHATDLNRRLDGIASTNISAGMIELIGKIQQAVPVMAALLRLFRMIPGSSLDTAEQSSFHRLRDFMRPAGVTALHNAKLLRQSGMPSDQIADEEELKELMRGPDGGIGMSEADAKAFQSRLKANRAAVEALEDSTKDAASAAEDAASAAEKFAEGMAELSRELALAPLDGFYSEVVSAADGMGIATEEIDAFVAAVTSGGLDAAPEKFRKIAAAMQEIKAINIMQDLQFEQEQMFRSDTEQSIFDTLRDTGIDIESSYGRMIAGQIRLNDALKTGKEIASEFMSGLVQDLRNGVSFTEALGNAFGRLGDRLLQMALDQAINMLFSNLLGAFGGGGFGVGNGLTGAATYGGGGGFFGIPGFDTGGWTGSGNGVAGFVHPEEFVVKAGPAARHRSTLEAMNSGAGAGSFPASESIVFAPSTNIEANGSNMTEGQFKALLDQRDKRWREQLPTFVRSIQTNPRKAFV